ncbi:MAG: response regulator [Verrucomicrobiota bacterium]|jgi:CheY-like chemotaxis protein
MNRPASNSSPAAEGAAALIYVVDDETVLLDMAAVVLESLGYRVRTFRTAEAALAAFVDARPRPSLIITDYSMLEMSGLALIAECRRAEPQQKTILVSGTHEQEVYSDAPCKPDRFLAKPYRAQELLEAVQALLGPAGRPG